jgi:hypothetical protein
MMAEDAIFCAWAASRSFEAGPASVREGERIEGEADLPSCIRRMD